MTVSVEQIAARDENHALEGQANDLPAALTPQKLIPFVPEKKTNLPQVLANLDNIKFLHKYHQLKECR